VVKQFTQFAVVGGLGTVTNLVCFFLLVDLRGLDPFAGALVAFAVAVTQNYALNELWTFNPDRSNRLSGWRYFKFVAFSLVALAVNLLLLWVLLESFSFPLKVIPQAIGILGGTVVNFVASRLITFR
jgi:dolichol-phosphate mannosyltransferase